MPLFQISIEEAINMKPLEYTVGNRVRENKKRVVEEYSHLVKDVGLRRYTLATIDYDFYILYCDTGLYVTEVTIMSEGNSWKVSRALVQFLE